MHMFFVAFNHRQNKMLQALEKAEMVALANDRQNMIYIDDGDTSDISPTKLDVLDPNTNEQPIKMEGPINVILMKREVDLE